MDVRQHTSGFDLVEILIVITIIGILASIAYPSYQQYIVKANRAAAQQFLLEAASVQHQYFLANNGNGYANQEALIGPNALLSTPSNVSNHYGISVALNATTNLPSFSITATPVYIGIQWAVGVPSIDNIGSKTHKAAGAKATVVKGFKFRGTASSSPEKTKCGIGVDADPKNVASDPLLPQVGQVRELYSYLLID
ncbi:MAG: type IV pilus assembly protein PilE [Arenicella sp.]|jgi:type IV pilus assembly protein PilE